MGFGFFWFGSKIAVFFALLSWQRGSAFHAQSQSGKGQRARILAICVRMTRSMSERTAFSGRPLLPHGLSTVCICGKSRSRLRCPLAVVICRRSRGYCVVDYDTLYIVRRLIGFIFVCYLRSSFIGVSLSLSSSMSSSMSLSVSLRRLHLSTSAILIN